MPNTIAQNLARLVAAKTAIANAIINKGGTVNPGDGFEEFPDDIASIMPSVKVYGYRIDPTESDPDTCVTYLRDAVGMTPASMDETTFSYGSWENAFFMPRPCMVKYDGTVDYYLNENDYNSKAELATITNNGLPVTFNGAEFPLTNYHLYGTSEGAGVQTENLWSFTTQPLSGIAAGYLYNGSINLSAGTYTLRADLISGNANMSCVVVNNQGTVVINTAIWNHSSITFTSDYDMTQLRFYVSDTVDELYLTLVSGSTTPTSYIPYGYKIPLTVTSGAQSQDYPIYIGPTKLGAEEYVDYGEQKVYRYYGELTLKGNEENLYYYGLYDGVQTFYVELPDNEVWVRGTPFLSCNYYATTYIVEQTTNKTCRYRQSIEGGEYYWRLGRVYIFDNDYTNLSDFKTHLAELYNNGAPLKMSYLLKDAPVPTDPPAPLPSITAYKGENTLSSTETVGEVTVTYNELSDIANPTYAGNAMIEWPKIYYKFESGTTEGEGYFYCSNRKIDDDYECWCNIDSENNEIDHFYTAIYNGTFTTDYSNAKSYQIGDWAVYSGSHYKANTVQTAPAAYSASSTYAVGDLCVYSGKRYECNTAIETAEAWDSTHWTEIPNSTTWNSSLWDLITANPVTNMRSLSGVRLSPVNGNGNTSGSTEVTRATANNTTSAVEWYIDVWSDRMLINALLILMSKSLNSQGKFGQGISSGSQAQKEAYITGTLDNKGMFYGDITGTTTAVKVFGMENWWSCVWRRTAGMIGINDGTIKVKMTYNTADGSTATSYNSTGNGYIDLSTITGIRPSSNYVKTCKYTPYGYIPIVTGSPASASTYYCDYFYTNNSATTYLLVGGSAYGGGPAGFSCFGLNSSFLNSYWNLSAAPSLKPLGGTARA